MIELSKAGVDVGIVVADIDVELSFYVDVLGLEHRGNMQMPDGGIMHRLECGESILKLIVPPASLTSAPMPPVAGEISAAYGWRYITIWAVQVDLLVERCRAAGRRIRVEPWEFRPGIVVGIVEDAEGNIVELVGSRA